MLFQTMIHWIQLIYQMLQSDMINSSSMGTSDVGASVGSSNDWWKLEQAVWCISAPNCCNNVIHPRWTEPWVQVQSRSGPVSVREVHFSVQARGWTAEPVRTLNFEHCVDCERLGRTFVGTCQVKSSFVSSINGTLLPASRVFWRHGTVRRLRVKLPWMRTLALLYRRHATMATLSTQSCS